MILDDMKQGIAAVKRALGAKDATSDAFKCYLIQGGEISATNGNLSAGFPIMWDGNLLVPGAEFEAAINRMPCDPTVDIEEGFVQFRAKKFRVLLPRLPEEHLVVMRPAEGVTIALDKEFIDKVTAVFPFCSDQDTPIWMSALNILEGKLIGVSSGGKAIGIAHYPPLARVGLMIPRVAIEFLLKRGTAPSSMTVGQTACSFEWQDGTWLRTNLLADNLPKALMKRVAQIAVPDWEITPAFRESYGRVSELSQSLVRLYDGRMTGAGVAGGGIDIEDECDAPVPPDREHSAWNPVVVNLLLTVATHWDPSTYPNPSVFLGPLVSGLVMGVTEG